MNIFNYKLKTKEIGYLEVAIILLFSFLPLLFSFPYKINIYLSWEGAYRISEGQMPFRDFGLPLGYTFWLIPALFFKIFGPYLFTLIKAQVFINLVSLFVLREIFKLFNLEPVHRFLSILVFCLTYVFINFWPWYNHSVFVFELIGLYFLINGMLNSSPKRSIISLVFSGLFIFLAFFTKQDIGGLAIVFAYALLIYQTFLKKSFKPILIFTVSLIGFGTIIILPLLNYEFGYWFNYGQFPHYSRINLIDYLNDIFGDTSFMLRFYLIAVLIVVFYRKNPITHYLNNNRETLFLLFTLGMIAQVMLAQVTSYIPANAHYYYHAIVFSFLISSLKFKFDLSKVKYLILACMMILFWQSTDYWRYGKRILGKVVTIDEKPDYSRVSKRTWNLRNVNSSANRSKWEKSSMKVFEGIYMPVETIKGIEELKDNPIFKNKEAHVLNMTELTPLAHEFGFDLLRSPQQPLWYHKNVSIFDRDIENICTKISNSEFDLVLFEHIPDLNEFYPTQIKSCLEENYVLTQKFLAPRIPETAQILVFEKVKE